MGARPDDQRVAAGFLFPATSPASWIRSSAIEEILFQQPAHMLTIFLYLATMHSDILQLVNIEFSLFSA